MDGRKNELIETFRAVSWNGVWLDPQGSPGIPPAGDGYSVERWLADGWRYVRIGDENTPPPEPIYPDWEVYPGWARQ